MANDFAYETGFMNGFKAGVEATQPKWISVEERLPEPCEDVLCYANDMAMEVMPGKWVREQYYEGYYKIYWMHLPEPPKEEDNEN